MRSSLGLASILLLSCLAPAAEPAKVSVYPTQPVVSGTLVAPAASPKVLAGTLIPVSADDPKPMPAAKPADAPAGKPMPPAGKDVAPAAPALVAPTVSVVPTSSCGSCGACDATPCGTPLFRGRLFAASCGADVCESPGRPALFGGLFCKSSCSTCESSGPCCPRAHAFLARLRAWLMFRPCDGPRVGMFRCEPYVARTLTVFPGRGCEAGTCHAAGACVGAPGRCGLGLGLGLGLGRGAACATGTCAADGCRGGMPTGPLDRLALGRHRTPQDCTTCEPKLSGAKFDECYHFANAIPKSYGCRTTRINPIAGCVTPACEGVAKDAAMPVAEPTKIEKASATLPAPHPLPASRPAKAAATPVSSEVKATNPLKTPFSNP